MAAKTRVTNAASALGEAVGKTFENGVRRIVAEATSDLLYSVDAARLVDATNNQYQIDVVVLDSQRNPIIMIDPKYIRYTKHNRDKVSWLCVAHHNLRKTYPTIRKSIAVLGGRWSAPSKALARSFGIEIFGVPFEFISEVLERHDVIFDWDEKDRETSRESWHTFQGLEQDTVSAISIALVESIREDLSGSIVDVLSADVNNLPARINRVELLMQTDRDETVVQTFDSVQSSIQYMTQLLSDSADVTSVLLKDSLGEE